MVDGGAPAHVGDVLLGRYQVEHVLGQGGMGMVVAARHLNLGELFAIKLLLPSAVQQPQAAERFLREARAAARLKSEHVAKVIDVGSLETGAPYMVMEHLSGSDLAGLIRARGPLPIEEAITYVLQACDAFSEAHSQGIVHRDIKPANLFLTRRPNGSPCIKVLDFGISKQLGRESVDLTGTHMSFGSPLYMSPEQMTRAKSADTRTDIWSIGIVLYELLTGTTPFLGESITEVVGRVLQEEPVPPSQIRPDLPPWIDAAILGCLQKQRDRRFQTIRELVDTLSHRNTSATMPLPAVLIASAPRLPAHAAALTPARGTAAEPPGGQTSSTWGQTGGTAVSPRRRLASLLVAGSIATLAAAFIGVWLTFLRPSERLQPSHTANGAGSTTAQATPTSGAVLTPGPAANPLSFGSTSPTTAGVSETPAAAATSSGTATTSPTGTAPTTQTSGARAGSMYKPKPKLKHETLD